MNSPWRTRSENTSDRSSTSTKPTPSCPVTPSASNGTRRRLVETEIDAFINTQWLITVRKDDGFSMEPVVRRWDRSPDLVVHGVSFLLYGLLDVVIDGYFDTVQGFDDYYDEVSEGLFADKPLSPEEQRNWFEMRRALVRFHRLVVPMREAVSGLMRREHATLPEVLYPYFQDVYDHVLRVNESTDSLGTSCRRSWRPTSACATTARTRS